MDMLSEEAANVAEAADDEDRGLFGRHLGRGGRGATAGGRVLRAVCCGRGVEGLEREEGVRLDLVGCCRVGIGVGAVGRNTREERRTLCIGAASGIVAAYESRVDMAMTVELVVVQVVVQVVGGASPGQGIGGPPGAGGVGGTKGGPAALHCTAHTSPAAASQRARLALPSAVSPWDGSASLQAPLHHPAPARALSCSMVGPACLPSLSSLFPQELQVLAKLGPTSRPSSSSLPLCLSASLPLCLGCSLR